MPHLQKMNLNYLLNKAYYEPITHSNFDDCNKALIYRQFQSGSEVIRFAETGFCLQTTYPGLLIGIGNTHQAGTSVGGEEKDGAEIKLGFTLDYVTGLPVIPGSTVKGVLRSAFKYHSEYVAGVIFNPNPDDKTYMPTEAQVEVVKNIWKSIFEEGTGKVVFFDALPVQANEDKKLLGLENITPHLDVLKSPKPLTLLKVIPNVAFLFRFGFEAWENAGGIAAKQLRNAFKAILCDLGVGAKTNVGFGTMKPVDIPAPFFWLEPVMTLGTAATHQTQSSQNFRYRKPEGICQWEGCSEKTRQKPNGEGFQKYCQPHFLEMQKK